MARHQHPFDDYHHFGDDVADSINLSATITSGEVPFDPVTSIFVNSNIQEYLEALVEFVTDAEVLRTVPTALNAVVLATQTSTPKLTFVRRYIPINSAQWANDPTDPGFELGFDPDGFTYVIAQEDGYWLGGAVTATPGAGTWVMGTENGYILTSDDPRRSASWVTRDEQLFDGVTSITYNGSDLWVAVGGNGIVTAADPTGAWTSRLSGAVFLRAVDFGGGMWVAAVDFGGYYTSPDGVTWTPHSATTVFGTGGYLTGIAYGDGVWVAIGGHNTNFGTIATATDPTDTWTLRHSAATNTQDLVDVAYDGTWWVALGFRGDTDEVYIATATDPTGTWTERDLGITPFPNAVVHGGGDWFILTQTTSDVIYHATDPAAGAWTTISMPVSSHWFGGGYANGVWAITGENFSDPVLAVSPAVATSPTIDAYIVITSASSFTIDAVIAATMAGSFTVDATIVGTVGAGSFTADAILSRVQTGSLAVDAVVLRTSAGPFTVDAAISLTIAGSATANAVIFRTQAGSFTLDAVIPSEGSGDFQGDAFQGDSFQ